MDFWGYPCPVFKIITMSRKSNSYLICVALLLGSAMFLLGCNKTKKELAEEIPERLPSVVMDSIRMKYSENGNLSYLFTTQQMKRYAYPDTLYMIFDKGVFIETFNDSTKMVESSLSADYAYFDEKNMIWEVRGNVVGTAKDGKQLFTEQLFWDQKKKLIHSYVKSLIVDHEEKIVGWDGFTANEDMTEIKFRNSQGKILIDTLQRDSAAAVPGVGQDVPAPAAR